MEALHLFVYILITASVIVYLLLRKRYSYWADRGVAHEKPVLFFGNLYGVGRHKPLHQPLRDIYMKYKGREPFIGFYLFMRHAVMLLDLDLIKSVLIKDFANFSQRGNYYNERDDPLSAHLFNLDGAKWRKLRAKLTPTFTSGKMKFMFPTIVAVAEKFNIVLSEILNGNTGLAGTTTGEQQQNLEDGIEVKELLARFTTDVIGTCAFGLECNSLRDPQTKFRLMGKHALTKRRHKTFVFAFMAAFPNLARKLHLKLLPDDISDFFMNIVRETVAYREREHIQRNDFMNLLIELKKQNETEGLTLEEIAAQAFVFFLAGFETSSSTMSFALYELAVNQNIQDKARAEILEVLQQHDNQFTYEAVHELKYLKQVLHETMRRYSIASLLLRKTLHDYPVPNSNHVIEKGTVIIVPVDAIHHDESIYPNPEVFNPERFEPSEIEKRDSITWLPFGDGPRNCIGLRFGEMQAIIGLAVLLKNYRFSPAKSTRIPIEIDPKSFLLAAKDGIVLKIEKL